MFSRVKALKRESDHIVSFELSKVPLSLANSIRRTCLSEVPITAIDIDSVNFSVDSGNINSSSFHDQFLGHRLSYLLVDVEPADINKFTLLVCDPNNYDLPLVNNSDVNIDVTAADIVVLKDEEPVDYSTVFPYDSLLMRLKPGQRLKGTMKLAVRAVRPLQPDDVSRYNFQPCRVKFEFKTPKHDTKETFLVDDSFKYYGHENRVPDIFLFEIKTFGVGYLSPSNVLLHAFEVLSEKLKKLKEHIGGDIKRKPSAPQLVHKTYLEIYSDSVMEKAVCFRVHGEDHTLGNMLREKVFAIQERLSKEKDSSYVAYDRVHPLESTLVLKVKNADDIKLTPEEIVVAGCDELLSDLGKLGKAWKKAIMAA